MLFDILVTPFSDCPFEMLRKEDPGEGRAGLCNSLKSEHEGNSYKRIKECASFKSLSHKITLNILFYFYLLLHNLEKNHKDFILHSLSLKGIITFIIIVKSLLWR